MNTFFITVIFIPSMPKFNNLYNLYNQLICLYIDPWHLSKNCHDIDIFIVFTHIGEKSCKTSGQVKTCI